MKQTFRSVGENQIKKLNGLNITYNALSEKFNDIYIISDTHFMHDNIIKYANRPASHNQIMFEKWNETVKENDLIIHVGDLSHGLYKYHNGDEILHEICTNLNGKKILLRGNHDRNHDEYYNNMGFIVKDYIYMSDINTIINHYPPISDTSSSMYIKQKQIDYNTQLMKQVDYKYLIHGHQHNNTRQNHKNCFNATVERINYTPINITEIFKILQIDT